MYALQLLIDGVIIGSLYAIVGLGQVVIFRTTRVLNFAQGAVATTAAYVAWMIVESGKMPWLVGMVVAVIVGSIVGGAIGLLLTYGLPKATILEKSIACLGVFLLLGWINRGFFGDAPRQIEKAIDIDLIIADLHLSGNGLLVVVVNAVAITAVFLLLNKSRVGLGMRALSQDEDTARGLGVPSKRIILLSWVLSSAVGAGSGVLVGSLIRVDHSIMTTIMIMSFAALVIGGFNSTVGAVVGGITLGVASSMVAGFLAPSYKNSIVFAFILLILIIKPEGLMGKRSIVVQESGGHTENLPALPTSKNWRSPKRLIAIAAVAVLVLVVPFLPLGLPLVTFSIILGTAIAVLSLSVFMGFVGEVSLGHGALVAVGAYTAAIIMNIWPETPFPLAVALAAITAGALGGLLGWATIRLSGLYLAVATLILSFIVTEVALQAREYTGGATGLTVKPPFLFGEISSDLGRYYLAAVTLGIVLLVVALVLRSRVGQRWVAVRDGSVAALANGVKVRRTRVFAFVFSSMIAGVAGAVLAFVITHVGPYEYGLFFSIFLLLAVVMGGAGSLVGSLIGAAFISLLPVLLNRSAGLTDAVFGIALILIIAVVPGGVTGLANRLSSRRAKGKAKSGSDDLVDPPALPEQVAIGKVEK